MWSFFSRDPAKDFHYDIGEKVSGLEDKSIWTLHKGKKKANGEPVSIFAFDVKSASDALVQTAKASLKRLKTLRHPNILTFLDGVETDKVIYFATEPVVPLETYLRENDSEGHNEIAISWGLHQIVKGLAFLVNDCNLIHNNVCMASIFVDPAGEWKLGGVDYMYPAQGPDSIPPVKVLPLLERYNSPEKVEGKNIASEKWSADMWGLGCLIWEVFNGTLPRTTALKAPGKIPQSLMSNYCELVGANPKSRPNPAKFIENCHQKGGFMRNTFVDSMMFLEEIQIKDQAEKNKFFASLTPSLDSFPSLFCRNKILPQLLIAFEYGNAGSSILAPLFKIGKLLDSDEYQKKMVPCVVKLFSSPDRATRVKLLQQIEFFAEHLQVATVNDQIFPHVNSGFMDTNPMVRECTIKAMLHLAPKLNYKNLNEELMRQFARLQAKDDQGGIRTNTTVCLGKIACYINPAIRQKILCSAFMRAMKDPFPPARQAGILGIASTQNFYNLAEVANRLLPSLCAVTRDPDKGVRDQAFKTIKGFLSKLEKVSEDPELEEEYEKEVMSGTATAASGSGWTEWAVTGMSSLTSKIYNKTAATKSTGDAIAPMSTKNPVQAVTPKPPPVTPTSEPSKPSFGKPADTDEDEDREAASGDGWEEEDWGDLDDNSKSNKNEDTEKDVNWEDDNNWDDIEDKKITKTPARQPEDLKSKFMPKPSEFVSTKHTGLPTTDTYNWGGGADTDDDFFSKVVAPKGQRSKSNTPVRELPPSKSTPPKETTQAKATPTTAKKTTTSSFKVSPAGKVPEDGGWDNDGGGGGGWNDGDDWGGDKWGDVGDKDNADSTADRIKKEKEDKKKQRQKEIQEKREARKGGGAMKLGAKKVTDFDLS